jgi:DNA-directed RNA polymerase specialized sigma24 family protein
MVDEKQSGELNEITYYLTYNYLLAKTKSWEGKGIDREHVAAISIFRAFRKFDATRKCTFRYFALTIMLNKLRDCAKRVKVENKYLVDISGEIYDSVRTGRFSEEL